MITLAEKGVSPYVICVSETAEEPIRFAAKELRDHFLKSTGAVLPLCNSSQPRQKRICIGFSPSGVLQESLAEEEILIYTENDDLYLNGGSPRGVLYSVYQFLETYLGIRWFAPECTRIPRLDILCIPEVRYRYKPPFIYRNCFVWTALHDPLWAVRNRLNATEFLPGHALDDFGGCSGHSPAGHSFYAMIPPEEYFDTHPEYFSLIDGKRDPHAQLCLSNPDVFRIVREKLVEKFKAMPGRIGVDVAQNDWLGACQCENCKKIDEKYHSFSGSILNFCNRLADSLKEEFPNRLIQTYAYQYGQPSPSGIRASDHVSVWLCSIEACFCHPHGTCDRVRRELVSPDGRLPLFSRDLAGWGKVADNLFVWNYDTNFRCFLLPHPNLHVLGPNLRFFRDHGVKGVFEQNCTTSPHTEMQELRAYILARCLWNPDTDDRLCLEEFTDEWFGKSAPHIRAYIRLLEDTVTDRTRDIHLFMSTMPDNPNNKEDYIRSSVTRTYYERIKKEGKPAPSYGLCHYLTPDNCSKAAALFEQAKKDADNETVLTRVRIAEMAIRYYELNMLPNDAPNRLERIDRFFDDCRKYGILQLKESKSLEECYGPMVNNIAMF